MQLLLGVRAEQSLRDAVRDAIERAADGEDELVLAPTGRKDWIAGYRIGETASLGEIAQAGRRVLVRLLALESRQRIRAENVRLWVVQPAVPVFRDPQPSAEAPAPPEPAVAAPAAAEDEGVPCPVCGRRVHEFNLQRDPAGRAVGCYQCGGVRRAGLFGDDPT